MYVSYIISHVVGFGFVTFEDEETVDKICKQRYIQISGKMVLLYLLILYFIIRLRLRVYKWCTWWELSWLWQKPSVYIQGWTHNLDTQDRRFPPFDVSAIWFCLKLMEVGGWEDPVSVSKYCSFERTCL